MSPCSEWLLAPLGSGFFLTRDCHAGSEIFFFTGRLIVARSYSCPCCKSALIAKRTHIRARLGNNPDCQDLIDPGYRVQLLDQVGIALDLFVKLLLHLAYPGPNIPVLSHQ